MPKFKISRMAVACTFHFNQLFTISLVPQFFEALTYTTFIECYTATIFIVNTDDLRNESCFYCLYIRKRSV